MNATKASVFRHLFEPQSFLPLTLAALVVGTGPLCFGHGAYHEVLEELTEELAVTPDDPALHFKLASAQQEHGEWAAALVELELVDRTAPGQYETGLVRGRALISAGHWQAAKKVLDEFLLAHAGHANALAERARAHLNLGDLERAGEDFLAAVESAEYPSAKLFLETAEVLVSGDRFAQAIEVLEKGVKRLGAEPRLLSRLLDLELLAQRYDAALTRIAALEVIEPRPEPWMARRAEVLTEAGRKDQARAAWTALRIHLNALPSLERGLLALQPLLEQAQRALGESVPKPVVAPPSFTGNTKLSPSNP